MGFEELDRASMLDGTNMALCRRGSEYMILAGGLTLMSSRMHGSEEALATVACGPVDDDDPPCVLVGGLGMGFTLRAALDAVGENATVVVAELLPAVVTWNKGPLGHLADHPLTDPRVEVVVGDVADLLRASRERFDAILLDVDNGPKAFTQPTNSGLYGDAGLKSALAALKPNGRLAVWSAWYDRKFEHRLRYAGYTVETQAVRARLRGGGPGHTIFVGRKAM